jgi:O-antigen ligase
MVRYIIVSLIGGILFGVLDGLIHANPYAQRLYEAYKPISRNSINPIAGIMIDFAYGFVLAGLFLLLYKSLPGDAGLVKGISYACMVWFFRVLMDAASQWIMFKIPIETLLYSLAAGLGEMLILGLLFGLTLKPEM